MRNRRFPVGLSTKFLADRTCTKSEMTAAHVSAERTNAKAIVITAKALAGGAYKSRSDHHLPYGRRGTHNSRSAVRQTYGRSWLES